MRLLIFIVFSFVALPIQGLGQTKTVTVLMTYHKDSLSVPSIELYRRIVKDVEESARFVVIPMAIAKQHMEDKGPKDLGILPAFDRRLLMRAHPPARSLEKTQKQHKLERRRLIAPVQSLVDTLAVDGSLLLDCHTRSNGQILRGCSLHYYDRARGQIVGSVTKRFRVGIRDASRWSHVFVAELSAGLNAERQRSERKKISQALSGDPVKSQSSDYLAEIRAGGQRLSGSDLDFSPSIGVVLGQEFDGFSLGLVGVLGRAESRDASHESKFEEKSLGLMFGVSSAALTDLEWDLAMGLAIARRQYTTTADNIGQTAYLQNSKDINLSLSPGLLWRVGSSMALGTGVTANRYFSLTNEQNYDRGSVLGTSTLGMNIRVRTIF